METIRLKQFCVIAETGSLSRAAELLHITHSGLSKSMKLLQAELRCQLLQATGRGLTLTQEGLAFYEKAKELLALEDKLFHSPAISLSDYRIGTMEIFLKPLVSEIHQRQFSNKRIKLLDLEPGLIENMLTHHQLDVGITYAPYPMPDIEIFEICQFKLGCYFTNPEFKAMPMTDIPFAVPAQGKLNNPLNIRERDGWIDSIYPRTVKYEVNLLSTALDLTMQGLCAVHIPDFIGCKLSQFVEHEFTQSNHTVQTAYLLKRRDQPQSQETLQLHEIIKNACGTR